MKESKAMEDVWRWKDAVCEDTRGMTEEQVIAFFRDAPGRLAEKTGFKLNLPRGRALRAVSTLS